MWEIEGYPQHYAWGSTEALPRFLGCASDGRPWAEVWFGAHPLGASTITGSDRALDEAIAENPEDLLGTAVTRGFDGHLPYLLKMIAPERPLSLQVHPGRELAQESYAAETAAGLAPDATGRNYKDANHKPEMLVALTRFEALCGFRTPRRAASVLQGLGTELTDRLYALLVTQPHARGMRAAFRTLVSPALRPAPDVVEEIARSCAERLAAGTSPSQRIDATVGVLHASHPGDPGVIAALLLNPVTLHPGEAMYVPTGTIHAYLHGTGVEIAAAGDNVLRAGLTAKKVDAEEMLRCVSVQAAPPVRIAPERVGGRTAVYYAPVDDFELSVTTVGPADGHDAYAADGAGPSVDGSAPWLRIPGGGPRILLGLEGRMQVRAATGEHRLRGGQALFVSAADGPVDVTGHGKVAQASVP